MLRDFFIGQMKIDAVQVDGSSLKGRGGVVGKQKQLN